MGGETEEGKGKAESIDRFAASERLMSSYSSNSSSSSVMVCASAGGLLHRRNSAGSMRCSSSENNSFVNSGDGDRMLVAAAIGTFVDVTRASMVVDLAVGAGMAGMVGAGMMGDAPVDERRMARAK